MTADVSHCRGCYSDVNTFLLLTENKFSLTLAVMYFLYRHYAADGRLLYIGLSQNLATRHAAHRNGPQSPWFSEVETITFEELPAPLDKAAALAAERDAIVAEKPIANTYKTKPQPSRSDPEAYWATIRARKALVEARRMAGLTWAAIGAELGVTRQRAQQLGRVPRTTVPAPSLSRSPRPPDPGRRHVVPRPRPGDRSPRGPAP